MKKLFKRLLLIVILVLTILLVNSLKIDAALQSNGNDPTSKNIGNWLLQIRQMQAQDGTLGRTDTINSTNLSSDATDLDIHMEKNTEFGAMAILSASSYGKADKVNNEETTTGNKTGILIKINKEWVSAGNLTYLGQYTNALNRYKNTYELSSNNNYVPKVGDATNETSGWHGSTSSLWMTANWRGNIVNESRFSGLLRSYGGSLFSFYGASTGLYDGGDPAGRDMDADFNKTHPSRAVIVNGNL